MTSGGIQVHTDLNFRSRVGFSPVTTLNALLFLCARFTNPLLYLRCLASCPRQAQDPACTGLRATLVRTDEHARIVVREVESPSLCMPTAFRD